MAAPKVSIGTTYHRKGGVGWKLHVTKIYQFSVGGHWYVEGELTANGRVSNGYLREESDFLSKWELPAQQPVNPAMPKTTATVAAAPTMGKIYAEVAKAAQGHRAMQPKASACDCGGHKCGYKDYTRHHFHWCKVYKDA
jgi:hypothetical protein